VKARDILNNTDPLELRNIIYRLKRQQLAAGTPPLSEVVEEDPKQFPSTGLGEFDPNKILITDESGNVTIDESLEFHREDSYTPGDEISSGTVNANDNNGVEITGLTPGEWYAIDGTGGPWDSGVEGDHYIFDMSLDGITFSGRIGKAGSAGFFSVIPSFAAFVEAIDVNYGRVYFEAPGTSVWFRCNDSTHGDNTGTLGYSLRSATFGEKAITLDDIEYVLAKLGGAIHSATEKTSVDNGDEFAIWDSITQELRKISLETLSQSAAEQVAVGFPVEFRIDGRLAALTGVAGRHIADGKQTIKYVYISCNTPGSAGNTVVDVNRNGSTIFVTQANRPSLAHNDSDGVAKSGIPDVVYLDENDVLTIDIDGTATGAEGLSVDVYLESGEDETNMTYLRSSLIDEIWSGNGLPAAGADSSTTGTSSPLATQPSNLLRVDRLSIVMDDNAGTPVMTAQPWVFYPTAETSINKLALVHQGHVNSLDQIGVGDTIRTLVEDGFTVVGFLMPADGDVPTHEAYPSPTGTLNYLKFFIEPVVRTINELSSGFSAVYMTGLSGGGWSTHLAAAVDARISISVPVSGALAFSSPVTLGGSGAYRDWEQDLPGITAVSDYPDLMVMAADKPGRTQIQILRVSDDCCFDQDAYDAGYQYDADVTADAAALGGVFDLIWDSTDTDHIINAFDIAQIEDVFGVP
jgi:hypothetical protein